jgi:ABC-type cobalamin/Fe3+-siderophores transport system ATPase subunit
MLFRLEITHVQNIRHLHLELNLDDHKLTCIVGKNGTGKTTLVRAIRTLSHSDTFIGTASRDIFSEQSSISYTFDNNLITFKYDRHIGSLNCKAPIPSLLRSLCAVELPMPHGKRFSYFQSASDADTDIRRKIILEEYIRPAELIETLSTIYATDRFCRLVEVNARGRSYYCILLNDSKYVREDYFSSGEYFLINLYRTIRSGAQLIVVDEIDMSLDAAAQVHLIGALRYFCKKYACNILFTTHSLAMMRMLDSSELLYMERNDTQTALYPASYNYIKSLLFGFSGWDRYILTEDAELQSLLEEIIRRFCKNTFFKYKIIYVGGGSQVADLLLRNRAESFLSDTQNVIAILDGDQGKYKYAQDPCIYFLPIDNVERAILDYYGEPGFPYRLPNGVSFKDAKGLFKSLQRERVMSAAQIYSYICDRNEQTLAPLVHAITRFLSQPS